MSAPQSLSARCRPPRPAAGSNAAIERHLAVDHDHPGKNGASQKKGVREKGCQEPFSHGVLRFTRPRTGPQVSPVGVKRKRCQSRGKGVRKGVSQEKVSGTFFSRPMPVRKAPRSGTDREDPQPACGQARGGRGFRRLPASARGGAPARQGHDQRLGGGVREGLGQSRRCRVRPPLSRTRLSTVSRDRSGHRPEPAVPGRAVAAHRQPPSHQHRAGPVARTRCRRRPRGR